MLGAIFDIDGTLLDSMGAWYDVMDRFFEENSIPLTEESAAKYKEMRLEDSIPDIISRFSLNVTFDDVIAEFRRNVADAYRNTIPLKPYAKEYLEKLHKSGIKIAVATSGYDSLCRAAFERLGILRFIDAFAYSSEVGVDKGNPDVYLLAAKRLGLSPADCVVYEDIVHGIEGAKKGGFITRAVRDSSNLEDTDTLKRISDQYIESWQELL